MSSRTLALALCMVTVTLAGGSHLSAALTRVSPYLTRAEAAAIILLARPDHAVTAPMALRSYADVYDSDWFATSIRRAAALGIVLPDTTGRLLSPFHSVSRATFLKMLATAFALPTNQAYEFTDVPPTAWYAPYAGVEQTYGLFTHTQTHLLDPEALLTQAEASAALQRFLTVRSQAQEEEARRTAIAQATGNVQLYTVISTKRLRVVFIPDHAADIAAVPTHIAPPERPLVPVLLIPSQRPKGIEEARAEILDLVNATRANRGLDALRMHPALERSAQAYAEQMAREGFFGHVDPKGAGLQARIDAVGYYDQSFSDDCQCVKGFTLGENLARGQRSADEVVRAWMDSPSHRDAILGEDFTDLGIGISSGIWVQHFGGLLMPGNQ